MCLIFSLLYKRLRRRIKRRAKSKGNIGHLTKEDRISSTGSLIDIHKEVVQEEINSVHLWLGKDYVNWITKDLYDPQMPFNGKCEIFFIRDSFIIFMNQKEI